MEEGGLKQEVVVVGFSSSGGVPPLEVFVDESDLGRPGVLLWKMKIRHGTFISAILIGYNTVWVYGFHENMKRLRAKK